VGETAPGDMGQALAATANGSEISLLEGVLVVSAGSGVGNAASQTGGGDASTDAGDPVVPNEENPRLVVERFITGVEDRLALALQESPGPGNAGMTAEWLRGAVDEMFVRVGTSRETLHGI